MIWAIGFGLVLGLPILSAFGVQLIQQTIALSVIATLGFIAALFTWGQKAGVKSYQLEIALVIGSMGATALTSIFYLGPILQSIAGYALTFTAITLFFEALFAKAKDAFKI